VATPVRRAILGRLAFGCKIPPVAHASGNAEDRRSKVGGHALALRSPCSRPRASWLLPPACSLICPPMKAMAFPSGDQRGTAICRPCNALETSAGAKIAQRLWPSERFVESGEQHQRRDPAGYRCGVRRQRLDPLLKGKVSCDQSGSASIALAKGLEEQFGTRYSAVA
jgi:hypothetical protein